MRGKHDIYIFYDASNKLEVFPDVATFEKGDRNPVKFSNMTGTEVTLDFDRPDLFDDAPPYRVPPGPRPFVLRREAEGLYNYTVQADGRTADPKIIVDP